MIVIDCHVHIYPDYDPAKAIRGGLANLKSSVERAKLSGLALPEGETIDYGLILTERSDCSFFAELAESSGKEIAPGVVVQEAQEQETLVLSLDDQSRIFIFAGRQIVTKEKLELLTILSDKRIEEYQPLSRTIELALNAHLTPVVNWAPGKWFGKRGELIKSILLDYQGSSLLISDTLLRPRIWREPQIMTWAHKQLGYRILRGSDPFPFIGEEQWIGQYALAFPGKFLQSTPRANLLEAIYASGQPDKVIGCRSPLPAFIIKQLRLLSSS